MTGNQARAATGTPSARAAQAIDELYRAHGVGLVRLALMLVGDRATAEDVVQEAFLGLYRRWARLDNLDNTDPLPYLRAAVLNTARSALRSRKRGLARLLRSARHDPPVWSAEAAAMEHADRRAVLAAVAALPPRQREVLALRYYLDLSEQEIAALLGVARGTVSATTAKAIAALARQFEGQSESRSEEGS
jgi:RNA polymerase sigma-70 factor (sigma-E family)